MKHPKLSSQYFVCIKNQGYEVSLERRKIYRAIEDKRAETHGLIRIKDESGQSYLYPEDRFVAIRLPLPVLRALAA
jgi:hypothetical protein